MDVLIKEVSDRDSKIALLRIELSGLESKYEAERLTLLRERDDASAKVEALEAQIEMMQNEIIEMAGKLKEAYSQRSQYLTDFDLEIQAKDRIINNLREQEEQTAHENILLREENQKNEYLINECKTALLASENQISTDRQRFRDFLEEREKRISELEAELASANQLLKAADSEASERDIAEISQSAAVAARLVRGNVSLTGIYHEHTQALSKIERLTEENKRLDNYIKEIAQEFEEKVPQFMQQQETLQKSEEVIGEQRSRLEAFNEERRQLAKEREALEQELTYAKTRLETAQVGYKEQQNQVKFLTYLMEKGQPGNIEAEDVEDNLLFRNIEQLHLVNVQLREKVQEMYKGLENSTENARKIEAQKYRELASNYEKQLQFQGNEMNSKDSHIAQLQEQLAAYKALINQQHIRVPVERAPENTLNFHEVQAEKEKIANAYQSLQERFALYREERVKADQLNDERLQQQIDLIAELRANKAKLETEITSVQINAQAAGKQVLQTDKDLLMVRERFEKMRTEKQLLDQKVQQLTKGLADAEDSTLRQKAAAQVLQAQLEEARINGVRLETELTVWKGSQCVIERLTATVNEMEQRLKSSELERVGDAEKITLETTKQFEKMVTEKQLLEQKVEQLTKSLTEAEEEVLRQRSTAQILQSQLEKERVNNIKLETELNVRKGSQGIIERLTKVVNEMDIRLKTSELERSIDGEKINALEAKIEEMRSQGNPTIEEVRDAEVVNTELVVYDESEVKKEEVEELPVEKEVDEEKELEKELHPQEEEVHEENEPGEEEEEGELHDEEDMEEEVRYLDEEGEVNDEDDMEEEQRYLDEETELDEEGELNDDEEEEMDEEAIGLEGEGMEEEV
ncbi:hypothetical protein QR680_013204 [Steinernema hermaphroditum]|uniref:Nucleoprotein TPR n=1 Tax=Steinernema hermaphroditum TaxID=289476 RepID=A0AA39I4Q1_9BILA|nr:hypothetical protein QR680_013204 [Steinernema hermaphroditum]